MVVGPTIWARYRPGLLYGLPLLSVLLSPFGGIAIQTWRSARLHAGHDGLVEQLLAVTGVQLLLGAVGLWILCGLWAVVPLVLTHRAVLFDERTGTLILRRGLRAADRADLAQVRYATGDAERGGLGLIGLTSEPGAAESAERQWVVPETGWDDAGFDGLRVLQAAAGLRPAPPRPALVAEARRARRERGNRELAARLGMPWRAEYAHDEAAFQAEFDRVRRVLGGRAPRRDGDPEP